MNISSADSSLSSVQIKVPGHGNWKYVTWYHGRINCWYTKLPIGESLTTMYWKLAHTATLDIVTWKIQFKWGLFIGCLYIRMILSKRNCPCGCFRSDHYQTYITLLIMKWVYFTGHTSASFWGWWPSSLYSMDFLWLHSFSGQDEKETKQGEKRRLSGTETTSNYLLVCDPFLKHCKPNWNENAFAWKLD